MSRVPLDTLLRRATVTSLLVAATALSAGGGGDDPGSESSSSGQSPVDATGASPDQAPDATPAETTPAETTPAAPKGEVNERGEPIVKLTGAKAARITDGVENAKTIAAESPKKLTQAQVLSQAEKVKKALTASGAKFSEKKAGESGSLAIVKTGNNSIMFFSSNREAASAARNYQQLIATNPGFGRVDQRRSRMYVLTVATTFKSADVKKYRALRDRLEKVL